MRENTVLKSEIAPPPLWEHAKVRYRMDVTFRCAITPFVARQNANVYLLMNAGNMFSADEPFLFLDDVRPHWKVPVERYAEIIYDSLATSFANIPDIRLP